MLSRAYLASELRSNSDHRASPSSSFSTTVHGGRSSQKRALRSLKLPKAQSDGNRATKSLASD
ncbi:hypothetical protein V6Z12_A01G165400 [Gossypium hirsutum]